MGAALAFSEQESGMPCIPQVMRQFCTVFERSPRPCCRWKTCLYLSDPSSVLHLNSKHFLHGFNRHWIFQECSLRSRLRANWYFVLFRILTRVVSCFGKSCYQWHCPWWYPIFQYNSLCQSAFVAATIMAFLVSTPSVYVPNNTNSRMVILEHTGKFWFLSSIQFQLGLNLDSALKYCHSLMEWIP